MAGHRRIAPGPDGHPHPAVIKQYAAHGGLALRRLGRPETFVCARCRLTKTSKLQAIASLDGTRVFCNACYGTLLSTARVKSDHKRSDDEREAEIIALVLDAIDAADALDELRASDSFFESELSYESRRFVGTALVHLDRLSGLDLDWSGSVLLLSKALEQELIERLFEPLREAIARRSHPVAFPRRLRRLEEFCESSPEHRRLELGAAAQVLDALARDDPDAEGIRSAYERLVRKSSDPAWLGSLGAISAAVSEIARRHRNPAAHRETVTEQEFRDCLADIIGRDGLLRKLVISTTSPTK